MNEKTVKSWIARAENDLKIGIDEMMTENPATDAICFHMQQCVEKYLKAFLILNGKEISKTHNIGVVIEVCSEIDSKFKELFELDADKLTRYAVEFRYPAEILFPSIEETKKSVKIAKNVKEFMLNKLK